MGLRSSCEKSGLNLSVSMPFKIGLILRDIATVCLLLGAVPYPIKTKERRDILKHARKYLSSPRLSLPLLDSPRLSSTPLHLTS